MFRMDGSKLLTCPFLLRVKNGRNIVLADSVYKRETNIQTVMVVPGLCFSVCRGESGLHVSYITQKQSFKQFAVVVCVEPLFNQNQNIRFM